MEYIQGISSQTALFFSALGFGFLLGFIYSVFRTFRLVAPEVRGFVFVTDFLYFTVCGILSFFFVLVTDEGRLRLYTLAGELLGWMIYYFSFGAFAMRISDAVAKLVGRLFRALSKPVKFLFRKIKGLLTKILVFSQKKVKKWDKKNKNHLAKTE